MKLNKLIVPMALAITLVGCNNKNPDDPPHYDEDSIQIHYQRKDKKYDDWALWLWAYPGGAANEFLFNGIDNFGAIAAYPLSIFPALEENNNQLGFIVKSKGSWEKKDVDKDRIMKLNLLDKDQNGIYHIYLLSGDEKIYINEQLQEIDEIVCTSFIVDDNKLKLKVATTTNAKKVKIYNNKGDSVERDIGGKVKIIDDIKLNDEAFYFADVTFASGKVLSQSVNMHNVYAQASFGEKFNYDGSDLGVTYTSAKSTFKVWAPLCDKVVLKIYNNGTPKQVNPERGSDDVYYQQEMIKGSKGVFSLDVSGDLARKYYTYTVSNAVYQNKEIVDPYAKGCGVNGLRGMIVDFNAINKEYEEDKPIEGLNRKALTVYETHIADLTSSDTWSDDPEYRLKAKTYDAFYTPGTTYTAGNETVKTGFDHVQELGVNAVQILPFFDQANDEIHPSFNWGYNPLNFNCLEGVYSLNPYDGYTRIKEFKSLVKAYHDADIAIIMDVVYNHMNNALGSNFDVLFPGYYFRYQEDGNLSNGSGCGNETASDMFMMRKFMLESTEFWQSEYNLDGFRFDLMGLHDLTTMEAIAKKLPKTIIYGEPWSGGTSTLPDSESAKQMNINKYEGYGAFNDQMRDALIKGGLHSVEEKGWVMNDVVASSQDDLTRIEEGILGHTYVNENLSDDDPNKTLNYVTCHDNYTLYDRMMKCGIESETLRKKMAMLANSVVFTSNGTTFMLAGEEFLRTKGGDGNSYNSGYKVNELDYSLKIKNKDMFTNYQKLIEFKQDMPFLHQEQGGELTGLTVTNNEIKYSISTTINGEAKDYIVIHVNGYDTQNPIKEDLAGYTIYLDTTNEQKEPLSSETIIHPYETIIAEK